MPAPAPRFTVACITHAAVGDTTATTGHSNMKRHLPSFGNKTSFATLATGMFMLNTTVADAKTVVPALSTTVARLDTTVPTPKMPVATLETLVAELSTTVAALKTVVAALDTTVPTLKTVVFSSKIICHVINKTYRIWGRVLSAAEPLERAHSPPALAMVSPVPALETSILIPTKMQFIIKQP